MYLDSAIALYKFLDLARTVPCPHEKIGEMEQRIGVSFPASFREFLPWAGEDCGDLFPLCRLYRPYGHQSHMSWVYRDLPVLNHMSHIEVIRAENNEHYDVNEMIQFVAQKETEVWQELDKVAFPQNSLVMLEITKHEQATDYLALSLDSDDPPVYRHQVGTAGSVESHAHFSEFISQEVERHEKRLEHLRDQYGLVKPIRDTNYLEEIKKRYLELQFPPPTPCTPDEVLHLERRHGFAFPDAFREFLLWGGHWSEFGMTGSLFFYDEIYDLKASAVELLDDNSFDGELPEDAVVFFMHQGYHFAFTRASTGEEGRVFFYNEGEPDTIKEKGTFADFLLESISWARGYRQRG